MTAVADRSEPRPDTEHKSVMGGGDIAYATLHKHPPRPALLSFLSLLALCGGCGAVVKGGAKKMEAKGGRESERVRWMERKGREE